MTSDVEVPMLRFRLGALSLALELDRIASLVPSGDVDSMMRYDPADALEAEATTDGQAAVLDTRPPLAILVGKDCTFETWTPHRVAALPEWLAAHIPPVLKPACGLGDDGTLVFILEMAHIERQIGN